MNYSVEFSLGSVGFGVDVFFPVGCTSLGSTSTAAAGSGFVDLADEAAAVLCLFPIGGSFGVLGPTWSSWLVAPQQGNKTTEHTVRMSPDACFAAAVNSRPAPPRALIDRHT